MILGLGGREFAHWSFVSTDTITAADVQFDGNGIWHAATLTQPSTPGAAGDIKMLLAGPLATSNPLGTLVLAAGSHPSLVRCTDASQLVVRGGGTVTVG